MIYCGECRTENVEGNRYCVSCSADLAAQRTPAPAPSEGALRVGAASGGALPHTPADDFASAAGDDARTRVDSPYTEGRLEIGTVFGAGRYKLEELLGTGGMGTVYRARDLKLNETVALKVIHTYLLAGTAGVDRLRNEVRVARRLVHPGIVRVYDLASEQGREFYTMEFVEGATLRHSMSHRGEPVSLAEAKQVLLPLLDALAHAHEQGTVHRDVKPENVLLVGGDLARPKLADFGIAKALEGETLTRTAMALGTPEYVAPEQSRDAAHVDARADLYSVGVMLYELLTGERPVGRFEMPTELRPELPAAVDRLVDRLLQRQPERRPSGAVEVSRALAAIDEGSGGAEEAAVDAEPPRELKPQARDTHEGAVSALEEKPTLVKSRFRLRAAVGLAAVAAASLLALSLAGGLPGGTGDRAKDVPTADGGKTSGAEGNLNPPPTTSGGPQELPKPVPPIPPVSNDGRLVVRSDVVGAALLIDNEPAGEPGPTEHALKVGTHRVTVSKSGYEEIKVEVEVTADRTKELFLNPKPKVTTGQIVVRSNVSGDLVWIDGKRAGPSGPQAHDLTPGAHRIRVEKAGYEASEQLVQMEREQQLVVRAELKTLPARLRVETNVADAKVLVDGGQVVAAGDGSYEIAAGRHRVRLERDGYQVHEEDVELGGGAERMLQVSLQRVAPQPPVAETDSDVPSQLVGTNYDAGVRALSAGDHDEAIQQFRKFLKGNPASPFVDDAQFWIGEAYYRKGQYHRAIIELNQVSHSYPSGDRAPAALVRQAEAFRVVGDRVDARLSLQKVINRYPGTAEAAKASSMLSEIGP